MARGGRALAAVSGVARGPCNALRAPWNGQRRERPRVAENATRATFRKAGGVARQRRLVARVRREVDGFTARIWAAEGGFGTVRGGKFRGVTGGMGTARPEEKPTTKAPRRWGRPSSPLPERRCGTTISSGSSRGRGIGGSRSRAGAGVVGEFSVRRGGYEDAAAPTPPRSRRLRPG